MRSDGRRPDELRPLSFEIDFTEQPLGSVLCSMGRTKVLCTASEELAVPGWMRGSGRGWLTAEYAMLPGATDRRSDRESTRGKVSGRTMEIQRLIGRSLRAVVSLEGLGALKGTIDSVRTALNDGLSIEGIVFCMYDPRTNLAQQVVAEVREHFGDLVYDTVIPVNIRLSESPSFGKPALLYDIESKGAQAYLQLAREVLARIGQGQAA